MNIGDWKCKSVLRVIFSDKVERSDENKSPGGRSLYDSKLAGSFDVSVGWTFPLFGA